MYLSDFFSIEIYDDGRISRLFGSEYDIYLSFFDELNQRVRSLYVIIWCHEFEWDIQESFKSCLRIHIFDGEGERRGLSDFQCFFCRQLCSDISLCEKMFCHICDAIKI